ncbi:hypothetical protein N3K66_007708 [Trichothecium roseum]|uniref:Uncharacterized protein n=1 Tax=Trichothecium roseum TaxID=47278 RepID=A0ACC0UWF3_9HYPO|nr:hypothetical protein N3K66_007708 [Trichothecium roseum]
MTKYMTPQALRRRWADNLEIALVDVREEAPYADSHPLFAVSVPLSELEARVPALVPRASVPVAVYDDGEGYAEAAARRLLALGYEDVSALEGGLAGYVRAGGEVYRDVNVPSKAFGELVEAISGTPSIPASEASDFLVSKPGGDADKDDEEGEREDVVVLDARRFEEYNTMSVPRGRSCPGGELLYRVFEAAPSPRTTVVVNCAGRTRSIVGAQTLINAGVPNKVVALRDGTIGWTLAGLELDGGRTERVPAPSRESAARAREHARRWAEDVVGVQVIGTEKLRDILAEAGDGGGRTTYLLDVRDPEEHRERGPPRGFVSAPGGQLVQATDEWVGVRGARLVLYDTDGVRARMTGSWLVQLGWEVYVLDEGEAGSGLDVVLLRTVPAWRPPTGDPAAISAQELKQKLAEGATVVIDLARSPTYAKGHIPGSWFASGPELARDVTNIPVNGAGPVVLTSPDGVVAAANAEHLRAAVTGRQVSYLAGGTAAWAAAGFGLETGEKAQWLSEPTDVYRRPYEGTGNAREAMRGYIEWEHGLVAQLANDGGVVRFRVVRPRGQSAA